MALLAQIENTVGVEYLLQDENDQLIKLHPYELLQNEIEQSLQPNANKIVNLQ